MYFPVEQSCLYNKMSGLIQLSDENFEGLNTKNEKLWHGVITIKVGSVLLFSSFILLLLLLLPLLLQSDLA